jgi:signal peptidase I
MNFNTFMTYFPLILLFLTVTSGLIWLVDYLFFEKQRNALPENDSARKMPWLADYAKAFFPVFLIVFIIRSFIAQPYSVPTQSLEPTVMPGDLLLVTQFSYGLHMPIWDKTILPLAKPKNGDIVVVHWPVNPHMDFVKRVIGIPGDHISFINGVLSINGHVAKQTFVNSTVDSDNPTSGPFWPVKIMNENLLGVKHQIYLCGAEATQCPSGPFKDFKDLVVPKGEYFLMGDNRVNSDDSRDWGFVPSNDIVGKGQYILYSKDPSKTGFFKTDWSRIGNRLSPHFF